MPRAKKHVGADGVERVEFKCPGCALGGGIQRFSEPETEHDVPVTGPQAWAFFNGSLERPTIRESVKVEQFWGEDRRHLVCHSFVTDGRIQFLNDCTHPLAGQTVDLPELP